MSIEFYTNEEIFVELNKRFRSCIVAGEEDLNDKQYSIFLRWGGTTPDVIGLVELIKYRLLQRYSEEATNE